MPTTNALDPAVKNAPVSPKLRATEIDLSSATIGLKTRFWRSSLGQDKVIIPESIDTIVLDFDHTVGLTERLHRASFKETTWKFVEEHIKATQAYQMAHNNERLQLLTPQREVFEKAWKNAGFMEAFGKPEMKSCEVVARCLKDNFEIEVPADMIRTRRFAMIAQAKEILEQRETKGPESKRLDGADEISLCNTEDVINAIKHAKPIKGLMEFLEEANIRGIRIGLCTGSSSEFVGQILSKFKLDDLVPAHYRVFCNDYDQSRGKPDPHPFIYTFEKMGLIPTMVGDKASYPNVLILEDSISGITAALASGAHVAFAPGRAYGPDLSTIHEVSHMPSVTKKPETKAEKLRAAIEFSAAVGTEAMLMNKGNGWTQLALPGQI